MGSSSLQDKTVRPGSFKGLYYYSDRHQIPQAASQPIAKPKKSHKKAVLLVVVILLVGAFFKFHNNNSPSQTSQQLSSQTQSASTKSSSNHAVAKADTTPNYCSANTLDKFIRISIDKRHLWACEGNKKVYDSPVITGLRGHAETETPVGTYKIYGKITNTTLTGSDSRGSWKDPVYYWMPFHDNQYGTYGFHDATWRDNSAFGQVSPDSEDASHGCVELPLAASKWLYDWAQVGTTLTVES